MGRGAALREQRGGEATALALALCALVACGGDDAGSPGRANNTINNTGGGWNNTASTNNTGGRSNNTTGGTNNTSAQDMGGADQGQACSAATELGVIGGEVTWRVDTRAASGAGAGWDTGCGFASASAWAASFEVAARARVSVAWRASVADAWVAELREGGCDAASARWCAQDGPQVDVLEPGRRYTLVLEPRDYSARGEVEVTLSVAPLVCGPVGEAVCAGEQIEQCAEGGARIIKRACGAACEVASGRCGADTCAGAVTLGAAGGRFLASDGLAYEDDFDAAQAPGCGEVATPGRDVVLRLPGLKAGQRLTVKAAGQGEHLVFVRLSCDMTQRCMAPAAINHLDGWTVPQAGDYLVIVDRRVVTGEPFDVDVRVE